jgi:hypothetical protein
VKNNIIVLQNKTQTPKNTAMRIVNESLKKDFKYLYKKQFYDESTLHMTFLMDTKSHALQMSISFDDKWCDVLCFISPTVLTSDSPSYFEALKTINYINWNVKSWGRFYIDSSGDIAYSLRLNYEILSESSKRCIREIEGAIDFYSDIFIPLLDVCIGNASYSEAKQFIDNMWGD